MKLSIIVPVYNVFEYLEECLDSLINQNYDDYEIIAVNDGSTDDSLKILKRYQKKYPKLIKVYDRPNRGVSSARNYGITKAKGKYLFFVDSDDYLLPNALEVLKEHLKKNYDIIEFPSIVGTKEKNHFEMMSNPEITDKHKRLIVGKPSVWNKVWQKKLYTDNDITFLEGVYYEDLATIPKLLLYAKKIKNLSEPLYFYRERPNSIMKTVEYNPKVDAIFPVLKQLQEYFNGKYFSEIEYLHIEHLLRGASIRYFDFKGCQEQLDKIVSIMKENYPNWQNNEYYKKESFKKKIMCSLFYHKKYKLIKLLRKI